MGIWTLIAAAAAAAAATASAFEGPPGGGARCDHWSPWESRDWGSVRRRETCSDGRIQEQCRAAATGVVTACRSAPQPVASAPQFDSRRPAAKKAASMSLYNPYYGVYRSSSVYRYSSLYGYTAYVSFVCSTSCIIGAVIGGLGGLAFIIGGAIVLYCMCSRASNPGVVGPRNVATTTTMVAAAQLSNQANNNQAFSGGYQGQQQQQLQLQQQPGPYPPAYPASYPPEYPPAYPPSQGPQQAGGGTGDSAFPPPYPA